MIGQNSLTKTILIFSRTTSMAKTATSIRPEACFNDDIDSSLLVPGNIDSLWDGGHCDETSHYVLIEVGDQNEFPTFVE